MNRIYFTEGDTHSLTLTEGGNTVVWDKDRSRFFTVQIDPDTDADFFDADEADEPSNALRPKPTPMPAPSQTTMNKIYFINGVTHTLIPDPKNEYNFLVFDQERNRHFTALTETRDGVDLDFFDDDEDEALSWGQVAVDEGRTYPAERHAAMVLALGAGHRLVPIDSDSHNVLHAFDAKGDIWHRTDPEGVPAAYENRSGERIPADAVQWVETALDRGAPFGVEDTDSTPVIFETTRGELKRLAASYLESATPAYAAERGENTASAALFEFYWKRLAYLEAILGNEAMNEISQQLGDYYDQRRRRPEMVSIEYKGKWFTREAYLSTIRAEITPQLGSLDYIGDDEWLFTPHDGSETLTFDESDLLDIGVLKQTQVGPNVEVDVDPGFPP